MQRHDASRNGKAKSYAFIYARIAVICLLKGEEYLLFHVVFDADAVVDDLDFDHVAVYWTARDGDRSAMRREFNGVGDKVDKNLTHLRLIPANNHISVGKGNEFG